MPVCERSGPTLREQQNHAFAVMIGSVQNQAEANNLDLRFVGGVITDLIGPETSLGRVDFANREIWLENTQPLEMMRSNNTPRDIDAIALSTDRSGVAAVKDSAHELNSGNRPYGIPSIPVSIESARRFGTKPWYKPQLVSYVEIDEDGRYFLTFDSIREEVDKETLEGWKYHIQNNGEEITLVGFNPYAHFERYFQRTPSGLKRKDRGSEKIANLSQLAHDFVERGRGEGYDFYKLFKSWRRFNQQLLVSQPFSVALKAKALRWYWDHLGTALAHGSIPGFSWTAHLGDAFG